MTVDLVRELISDALNEYKYLAIRELRWDCQGERFVLTVEDGSQFELDVHPK